jgi:hypothetical protein
VAAFLRQRFGRNVKLRIGHSADDDLLYASQATVFVPAAGGFSTLLAALVKMQGGRVLTSLCAAAKCKDDIVRSPNRYWSRLFCR